METNIKLEQINHHHIKALQQIGRQTFSETFAEKKFKDFLDTDKVFIKSFSFF